MNKQATTPKDRNSMVGTRGEAEDNKGVQCMVGEGDLTVGGGHTM